MATPTHIEEIVARLIRIYDENDISTDPSDINVTKDGSTALKNIFRSFDIETRVKIMRQLEKTNSRYYTNILAVSIADSDEESNRMTKLIIQKENEAKIRGELLMVVLIHHFTILSEGRYRRLINLQLTIPHLFRRLNSENITRHTINNSIVK